MAIGQLACQVGCRRGPPRCREAFILSVRSLLVRDWVTLVPATDVGMPFAFAIGVKNMKPENADANSANAKLDLQFQVQTGATGYIQAPPELPS